MYARDNSLDIKCSTGQTQTVPSSVEEINYNNEDKYIEIICDENKLDLQSMFNQNLDLKTEHNPHLIFNHQHSDSLKSILLPI